MFFNQFEYVSEGESDFEGDFKKRDEDIVHVIGSDGYMTFKDKSQLKDDDKIQVYGVDKSAPVAPLLTLLNNCEPDNTVTPILLFPSNETVSKISNIRVRKSGNLSDYGILKSCSFGSTEPAIRGVQRYSFC